MSAAEHTVAIVAAILQVRNAVEDAAMVANKKKPGDHSDPLVEARALVDRAISSSPHRPPDFTR